MIRCQFKRYLKVELELILVAIQKYLVLLHDYKGPETKKLWLHTHTLNAAKASVAVAEPGLRDLLK